MIFGDMITLIELEKKTVGEIKEKRFIINAYNVVIKKILQKYKVKESVTKEKLIALELTKHMTQKLLDFSKKKVKKDNKIALAAELTTIIGIGPKLAEKLIGSGVEKLSDLKKKKYFEGLPEVSKKYIEQEPERKIPHEVIERIEKLITFPQFRSQIVGSYRRNTKFSKDIDVMLVSDFPEDLSKYIKKISEKFEKIFLYASGKDKASFLVYFDKKSYKLDVFLTPEKYAAAMLLYSTGSKENNIKMRGIAKNKGFVLNQKGLFRKGERIDIKDEKGFFDILGIPYLIPSDR